MKPRRLTVLCAAKLHKNQLERHLELLERLELVERIIVVRHEPLPERLSKLENASFGQGNVPASLVRMFRGVDDALRRRSVDWVIGFNPVPWGAVAELAARRRGVSTCLSLIGRDFLQMQRPWGFPFVRALRHATRITVTGRSMREGVVKFGVQPERVFVLPHSVDLERFSPAAGPYEYDIVSVGQLIRRKRMDVLLRALAVLAERGLRLRLGILGRGQEEARLRALCRELGLDEQVSFLGYRDDVEAVLRGARLFALVSAGEGVPFALMEAMASGVVPVVTGVGTIGDWVEDGRNGKLVPVDDVNTLAATLHELHTNDGREIERLRAQLLVDRERLGLDQGVEAWRRILGP
jgi:glycosyltransferase involved in cell wall biosynthesis